MPDNIAFRVQGGARLSGDLHPQGAKNEALQILCSVLLTDQEVVIRNVPDILDVNNLISLLADLGVRVKRLAEGEYAFQADSVNLDYLETPAFRKQAASLRGSVMILGPLLGRFGKAKLPKPGGDKIGRRRLDTHFLGLQNLGAKFNYEAASEFYEIDASALKGCFMLLNEPSVTGTANTLMAATLAKGHTTIYNAACEPYLQQLSKLLVSMGAKIDGIGSNRLEIDGVETLGGAEHRMLPDMIEIGSFIGLAAMTASEVTIKDARIDMLGQIPDVFRRLGIQIEYRGDDIHIPAQENYEIDRFIDGSMLTVADGPWPMFTPDLLSIVLVVATQARGSVLIHQKMFESRLFFVDKLIDMGAQIILCDPHRATVVGLDKEAQLRGVNMTSPDIRAGVSMLIAAMSADGESIIYNANQIERGYQHIDRRLNAIGAQIERFTY